MGEGSAIPFRKLIGRFRLALTLSTELSDQTRRVAFLLLEMTNRGAYEAGGGLLTWIGGPSTAAVLGINERTAKRARAALAEAGIIVVVKPDRVGRGHTAKLRFSIAWLARTWEALRARGLLRALGYADDEGGGDATLPGAAKGGDGATLFVGKGGGAATLPRPDKGGGAATLSPPATLSGADKGVAPATLSMATGDGGDTLPANGAGADDKGGGGTTLSRSAPVDKLAAGSVAAGERVAGGTGKGDNGDQKRVAALSPKPSDINPGTQPRAPARPPAPATAPPAQRSMMLPIAGGRDGADAALADWRKGLNRKQDQRLDTALRRAAVLLGDQRRGSLAMACLDPELRRRILTGALIPDGELLPALQAALASFDSPPAPPGPAPAEAALGDRMDRLETRFDRIEAMLMQVLGARVAVGVG